jgi:hypothetical protein
MRARDSRESALAYARERVRGIFHAESYRDAVRDVACAFSERNLTALS